MLMTLQMMTENMMIAAQDGHLDAVEILLKHKPRVEFKCVKSVTTLPMKPTKIQNSWPAEKEC